MSHLRTEAILGLALPLAGVAGAATLVLAPKHVVVCADQHRWEARVVGDRFGHVDGADFTGCLTPYTGSYAAGAAAVALILAGAGLSTRTSARAGT